jgi:hypothetical protein
MTRGGMERVPEPAVRPRRPSALLTSRDAAADIAVTLKSRETQVARSAFLRVPCGAILWPVMAGGAWRGIALSMLVHFAAATGKMA